MSLVNTQILTEESPEALILQVQQATHAARANAALEELVRRYQNKVYALLVQLAPERNDIADLTQEVLIRMCRGLPGLKDPKTFKGWLNRIVTHVFYDQLRKQARRPMPTSLDAPAFSDNSDGPSVLDTLVLVDAAELPEYQTLTNEQQRVILQAIASLPEPFRTALVLREVEEHSYDEISQLLQIELGTVKSRIARARLKLKDLLAPYCL